MSRAAPQTHPSKIPETHWVSQSIRFRFMFSERAITAQSSLARAKRARLALGVGIAGGVPCPPAGGDLFLCLESCAASSAFNPAAVPKAPSRSSLLPHAVLPPTPGRPDAPVVQARRRGKLTTAIAAVSTPEGREAAHSRYLSDTVAASAKAHRASIWKT